jgi:hypothetical protein
MRLCRSCLATDGKLWRWVLYLLYHI